MPKKPTKKASMPASNQKDSVNKAPITRSSKKANQNKNVSPINVVESEDNDEFFSKPYDDNDIEDFSISNKASSSKSNYGLEDFSISNKASSSKSNYDLEDFSISLNKVSLTKNIESIVKDLSIEDNTCKYYILVVL